MAKAIHAVAANSLPDHIGEWLYQKHEDLGIPIRQIVIDGLNALMEREQRSDPDFMKLGMWHRQEALRFSMMRWVGELTMVDYTSPDFAERFQAFMDEEARRISDELEKKYGFVE